MARFFLSKEHISGDIITIDGDDAHHICYSLRMAKGDRIVICDTEGNEYHAELIALTGEQAVARICSVGKTNTELGIRLVLFQALPKGEKMDWIVQKATELGVSCITPVESERCIVHFDAKAKENKCRRWEKIAHEAAKQCGRGVLPAVSEPLSFDHAVLSSADLHLFCYEGDGVRQLYEILHTAPFDLTGMIGKTVAIWIGPEGGWAPGEVLAAKNAGMQLTGLGRRILRTETAALAVCSAFVYELESSAFSQ